MFPIHIETAVALKEAKNPKFEDKWRKSGLAGFLFWEWFFMKIYYNLKLIKICYRNIQEVGKRAFESWDIILQFEISLQAKVDCQDPFMSSEWVYKSILGSKSMKFEYFHHPNDVIDIVQNTNFNTFTCLYLLDLQKRSLKLRFSS